MTLSDAGLPYSRSSGLRAIEVVIGRKIYLGLGADLDWPREAGLRISFGNTISLVLKVWQVSTRIVISLLPLAPPAAPLLGALVTRAIAAS